MVMYRIRDGFRNFVMGFVVGAIVFGLGCYALSITIFRRTAKGFVAAP